jgi:hypothetical protein
VNYAARKYDHARKYDAQEYAKAVPLHAMKALGGEEI